MKTGIKFERCNIASAQKHNQRAKDYLEAVERSGKKTYEIFHDRTPENLHWTAPAYAGQSLEQILQTCRMRYKASTGQNPQEEDRVRTITNKKTGLKKTVTTAGWSPIREGVCPVKEDTGPHNFRRFIEWMEQKGVHVISIDIHRDEGYQDPVTGKRKYNLHAHVIVDWTDHATGKTAKLNKQDATDMQTVLAESLRMERGESKAVTGAEHLTAQQYREKMARENAARLETRSEELSVEIARTEQSIEEAHRREADAMERAAEMEKAASREQLRNGLADVGARVANVFGRGAIAVANADRDEALGRAEDARLRAERAEQAARIAREEKESYGRAMFAKGKADGQQSARIAREEKESYGREMFAKGKAVGQQAARAVLASMQERLTETQDQLHKATERAAVAEKEVNDILVFHPFLRNWRTNLAEMRKAGMSLRKIQEVFRRGSSDDVDVPVFRHGNRTYKERARVFLAPSAKGGMFAWFNNMRFQKFLSTASDNIREKLGIRTPGIKL